MKLKKVLAGHLLTLAIFIPHTVLAEDFNFAVKFDIKNLLLNITDIKVACIVSPDNRFLTEFQIGSGTKKVKVPASGSISQTVKVRFSATPGKNPADATDVACSLILIDRSGKEFSPLQSTDSACNQTKNFGRCQKPGTQFTKFIRDPLT
jgi:hypothetical protein